MRRTTVILVVAGLALEILALGILGSGQFPGGTTINPRYAAVEDGLEILNRSGALSRDDPGFPVLASIFLAQLEAQNPGREIDVNVTGIERPAASTARSGEEASVVFSLSNGQTLDWDVSALESHVESLASARRLWIAAVVFGLGVTLQLVALALRRRARPEA